MEPSLIFVGCFVFWYLNRRGPPLWAPLWTLDAAAMVEDTQQTAGGRRFRLRQLKKILPSDRISVEKHFPRFYEKCQKIQRRQLENLADDNNNDTVGNYNIDNSNINNNNNHNNQNNDDKENANNRNRNTKWDGKDDIKKGNRKCFLRRLCLVLELLFFF